MGFLAAAWCVPVFVEWVGGGDTGFVLESRQGPSSSGFRRAAQASEGLPRHSRCSEGRLSPHLGELSAWV